MSTAPRPESVSDIETGPESEEIIRKFTKPFPAFDEAKSTAKIKKKYKTANDLVKGPAFTKDKLDEMRLAHEEAQDEYWENAFAKAALDPLTGRILAIGIRENGHDTILIRSFAVAL